MSLEEEVAEVVRERGPERVAVQVPEGLKRRTLSLTEAAREAGADALILGDPCFGACDPAPPDLRALGVDLVIHVGHTSMELDALPTAHVPYEPEVDPTEAVREAAGLLGDEVGVITTAQHASSLDRVIETLEEEGVAAEVADRGGRKTGEAQVLGCDLGNARTEAPELLYVGTGEFHPIGAAVATGKPVVKANPVTGEASRLGDRGERFVRRRFGAIASASEAETWGVVVGRKPGQRRRPLAEHCLELLREAGREAALVAAEQVTPELLLGIGADAYVNTACPRLSLDDTSKFDEPLLTPPELEIALGEREEYRFDEFGRLNHDPGPE